MKRRAILLACVLALAGCASPTQSGVKSVRGVYGFGGEVEMTDPSQGGATLNLPAGWGGTATIYKDAPAPNFNIGAEDPRAKNTAPPVQVNPPSPQQ